MTFVIYDNYKSAELWLHETHEWRISQKQSVSSSKNQELTLKYVVPFCNTNLITQQPVKYSIGDSPGMAIQYLNSNECI